MKKSRFALRLVSLAITLVLVFSTSGLSALGADESDYVAEFRIAADKTSAVKGEDIEVSVYLKTNYYICTMSLAVIYNSQALTLQNTSETNVSSFLTFSGTMAEKYTTNGNWTISERLFKTRNSNASYWSREDVMEKYKIAYATWSADTSISYELAMLSEEEKILSFTVRANEDIPDLTELVFISMDFQKTAEAQQGVLFVGRSETKEYSIDSMVNVGQTIVYNGKDPTKQDDGTVSLEISGTVQSFGEADAEVTLKLYRDGEDESVGTVTVTGNTAGYAFGSVASGVYTLVVSKDNHATRYYTIGVNSESVTQDVKIHLFGDLNGNGKANTPDVALVNACAKGVSELSEYEFACADINGDGKVNMLDVARVNAHSKGSSLLW